MPINQNYQPANKIVNSLQKEIVGQALDWMYKKKPNETWEETASNRGILLNEMKKKFGFRAGNNVSDMWCAQFGWGILNEACKAVGCKNELPQSAGALALLNGAKKTNKVIVKSYPEVGALMYRKSGSPDSSGHIGIVVKVDNDGSFITIEGNIDDKVGMARYQSTGQDSEGNNKYFANGGSMSFMWVGRFPHKEKTGRSESIDIIEKKVADSAKSNYLIMGKPSDTDIPTPRRRRRREFN